MAALKEGPVYDVTVESGLLVVDGNDLPIVHARPDGMPDAGLVLHPDLMGLRPLLEDISRRLATYGFGVCAIEPYAHVDAEHRANVETRMAAAKSLDDDTQLADLDAAANLLVVEDDVTRGGARVLHGRLLHLQGRTPALRRRRRSTGCCRTRGCGPGRKRSSTSPRMCDAGDLREQRSVHAARTRCAARKWKDRRLRDHRDGA
jgi:hypothetical protein